MNIWKHTFMAMIKNPKSFIQYYKKNKHSFSGLSEDLGYSENTNIHARVISTNDLQPLWLHPWDITYVYRNSTPQNFLIQYYDSTTLRYYIIAHNININISEYNIKHHSQVDVELITDACEFDISSYIVKFKNMINVKNYERLLHSDDC